MNPTLIPLPTILQAEVGSLPLVSSIMIWLPKERELECNRKQISLSIYIDKIIT